MDALMAATEEQLAAVDGVGPKIAHSTYLFLRTPDNVQVIERLAKHGVRLADDVDAQAADALDARNRKFARALRELSDGEDGE